MISVAERAFRWQALFLATLILLLAGCSGPEPEIIEFNGETMASTWSVKIADMPASLPPQQLADRIQGVLDGINQSMSTYRDDSELSRFNQAPAGTVMAVSPDLFDIVQQSLKVWRLSQGTFDITVGPLVNLWGFGPEGRPDRVPDETTRQAAWKRVGSDALVLHTDTRQLEKQKDLYLDLSGIAQGFAADRVAALLEEQGIRRYLVEINGEMRIGNGKTPDQPWRIAVERPVQALHTVDRIFEVVDVAVATSGDYRNYFEFEGKRYSHTVDPRTGKPIDHTLVSATVITGNGAEADAWATAMMVLGPEQGLAVADANGLAVYLLVKVGDQFEARHSRAFEPYLKSPLR